MSVDALNFIRQNRRAGGFAQAVLLFLADSHNGETGLCCPGRETIAEYFSAPDDPCSIRRIERALARLRELGFITSACKPYREMTSSGAVGGWRNEYEFPGLAEYIAGLSQASGATPKKGVTPKTYVTPKSCVTPEKGVTHVLAWGSVQNEQGVAHVLAGGSVQNVRPNQKESEEIRKEPEGFSPAFACDAPADGVAHKTGVTPSPDDWASLLAEPAHVEDDYPADLFSDVDPATAKVPAPKPRTNARTSSSSTSSRAKPKRLCPFDLDAVIPDDWRDAFAADFPSLDLGEEFRKFVGWHVAKGNTYADWKAAFRNWLGNAVKFQARDRNYSKDNRHDVQASRQGSILTPQSEYDYSEGLRIFEARRAARRARDA